jgi:hypothetical protein
MAKDFDLAEEDRWLRVPTPIVAADCDMAPPSLWMPKLIQAADLAFVSPDLAQVMDLESGVTG